jgi:hypothetical protein
MIFADFQVANNVPEVEKIAVLVEPATIDRKIERNCA